MRLVQLFEDQPHQRYVSGILEGPQGGVLYHTTDIMNAARIMLNDEMKAEWCEAHDSDLIEGRKDFAELLTHPLLKVMPFPGPVRYVNPRKQGAAAIPG